MKMDKEIQSIREEMEKRADTEIKPILAAYKRALNRVKDEVAKIYMEYSLEGELKISRRQRYVVLKQLEKLLKEQAKALGSIDEDTTTKILKGIYEETFYKTAFIIDSGVDIAINFAILKPEFVKAAIFMPIKGEMFSDRIWSNKEKLVKKLRIEIEKGMIQGDSVDKMAKRIKKQFGSSAYESKRLVHTEMARCMTQAQDEIYKSSGVVDEIMFDATLDDKTSDICQENDGKIFDINSDYPKPPLHPNCRSCIIPVVNGWKPTKKRENIKNETGKKPIIDYSTYDKWKESRGIE